MKSKKMKKITGILLASMMLVTAFVGCGSQNASMKEESKTGSTETGIVENENASSEYEVVTIDNYNRVVEFVEKPEKVVVLTLNSAEIIAALGEADAIVGIARNANTVEDVLPEYKELLKDCVFPEEINKGIPTLEGMLGLEPQLVVGNYYYFNVPDIFGSMEDYQANDVEFYITEGSYVSNCTIENTYNDIRNLGAIFAKQDEAEAIIADMQERLDAVAEKVSGQEEVRVMSLDSISDNGFCVAGGVGLAQNLIELAGGINVFEDVEKQFPTVSIEEIISRSPEVIVIHAYTSSGANDAQEKINQMLNTEELSEVPAIKNNNIIIVPLFQVNPSIQNIDYVEDLAAAMYPDLFEQ